MKISLEGDNQAESLVQLMTIFHCFTSFYQLKAQSIMGGVGGGQLTSKKLENKYENEKRNCPFICPFLWYS